jgi:hypothetical protein
LNLLFIIKKFFEYFFEKKYKKQQTKMSDNGTPNKTYRWAMFTPLALGVSYALYNMGFKYFDEKERELKCIFIDKELKTCTTDMIFYIATGKNRDRAKHCAETFDAMYVYGIESHCRYPNNRLFEQYFSKTAREDLVTLVADTRSKLYEDKDKQQKNQ